MRSNVAITGVQSLRWPDKISSWDWSLQKTILSCFESAVNLYIPPLQFAMKAEIILEVDTALAILSEIDFKNLPVRMDKETLRDAIMHTYDAGQRLNEEQRDWFNSRMIGVKS